MFKNIYYTSLTFLFITIISFGQVPTNGLIAYYPFNNNASDESGNDHNGTMMNSPSFETGINGLGIRLNGAGGMDPSGSHVVLPVSLINTINSSATFSISLWVKQYYTNSGEMFINFGLHGRQAIYIMSEGSDIKYCVSDEATKISTPFAINGLNRFVHYVLTYDNGITKAYRNGTLVGSSNQTKLQAEEYAGLGRHWWNNGQNTSTRLNGVLDEIRIYNRELSQTDVNNLYSEGLVSITTSSNPTIGGTTSGGGNYNTGTNVTVIATPNSGYSFSNWTENSIVVSSSSSYSFLAGANRALVANFISASGHSLYFDGVNKNRVDISNSGPMSTILSGKSYTIETWIKRNPLPGVNNQRIFSKDYVFGLSVNDNKIGGSIGSSFVESPYPNDTLWHHIAFVRDQSNKLLKIFVDGILLNTAIDNSTSITNNSMVCIGARNNGHGIYEPWKGSLCWLRVSSIARYNSTFTPALSFISDNYTIALWPFNEGGGNILNDISGNVYNGSIYGASWNNYGQSFLVTASQNLSNGGTTDGSGNYLPGSSVTIRANANSGYVFSNWTENGTIVSTNSSYTFTVSSNRSLVANFVQLQYTITTSSSPSNGGATTGGGNYNSGSNVTVTAIANSGYTFINWTENGSVVSTNSNYSFTINSSRNLIANFSAVSTQFTVNTSSNPSAGGTTTGNGTFNSGSSVTVTAIANSGYSFSNWTENGNIVSTSSSYSFTINSNRNLLANFTVLSSLPSLKPITTTTNVSKGNEFIVQVKVGDPNAVTDLYGLSFNLSVNNSNCTYVDGSASQGDFLGSSILFLPQKINSQNIDIAVTKTSAPGSNGSGIVANLKFTTPNTLGSDQDVIFNLNNIVATNSNGNSITMSSSSLTVKIEVKKMVNVWPGDCDNNGTVSAADLLRIGQYYNHQRPGSNTPGNQWQAYAREPWILDATTPKIIYADANGDGTINASDVLPIGLNYGKTHVVNSNLLSNVNDDLKTVKKNSTINPSIKLNVPSMIKSNTRFKVEIEVGNPFPVSDLYGIALTIKTNQKNCSFIDNTAYEGSFLGSEIIKIFQKIDDQKWDIALSRTSTPGKSGGGIIASLEFQSEIDQKIDFEIENLTANDSKGNSIELDISNSSVLVGVNEVFNKIDDNHLDQNFPNPFNPTTTINYKITNGCHVSLKIFDLIGNEIRTLINQFQPSGSYSIKFDASGLPSGIYYYQLIADSFKETKKLILTK